MNDDPAHRRGPILNTLSAWLLKPTDAATLAAFRIGFGVLMLWTVFATRLPFVERYYGQNFNFPYPFFAWVKPLPGYGMHAALLMLGIAALGFTLGAWYRVCTALMLVLYTYQFLIEATNYNNHYYLVILLGILFLVTHGHAEYSVDRRRKPDELRGLIPFWHIAAFRAQFVILYFFGAVAKMNTDWLRGEPMRGMVVSRDTHPLFALIGDAEWVVWTFAGGGLLLDLLAGPMLLFRRTRPWIIPPLIAFHVINMAIFEIGIFPILGIVSIVVFLEPKTVRRWFGTRPAVAMPAAQLTTFPRMAGVFLAVFFVLQLLLPVRHHLYGGNVSWTEQGHNFAWHMKLRSKLGVVTFYVEDPATANQWVIDEAAQREFLTERQMRKMIARPQLLLSFAHYLRDRYEREGIANPVVRAEAWVSLNGRPHQLLIDPARNLSEVTYPVFARADWILHLPKDLPIGIYPSVERASTLPES